MKRELFKSYKDSGISFWSMRDISHHLLLRSDTIQIEAYIIIDQNIFSSAHDLGAHIGHGLNFDTILVFLKCNTSLRG